MQEIDIVATGLSITYPRSSVIDFTLPYSYDPISLMIPFPELEMTISGITKPFQTMVCTLICKIYCICL